MIYKCYFALGFDYYQTIIPSINQAKEGFWVDEEYDYTVIESEAKYWISPSVVRYCEKV
jgi:hypothetical protein